MTAADLLELLRGAGITVSISMAGIVLGLPLGLAMGLIRWARVPFIAPILGAYVSVVRATPLITLALLIFFALPNLGIEINPIPAAVLSLMLNTAAFNCEIWRGGLVDFSRDQLEAARAFGMRSGLSFRRIVLPQVWRTCLPALVNEMTLIVKGSPAIAVAGVVDVTRAAVRIGAETYEPLPPLLAATALYVIIVACFVSIQRIVERRSAQFGLQEQPA
jgi:His/Glu/Gln/Arg/opine family amino acid ABC transporter permease subunit